MTGIINTRLVTTLFRCLIMRKPKYGQLPLFETYFPASWAVRGSSHELHALAGWCFAVAGARRAGTQRWSNDLDESLCRWRRALVLVLVLVLVSRILEHVVNSARYRPMAAWQTPCGRIKTNGRFFQPRE